EDGNACVRGKDDRLATFIHTDLQGSVSITEDLIATLKSDQSHAEFNGNAHSVSITPETVVIDSNFDDEMPDRRLSRTAFTEQLEAWLKFIRPHT
ncbi:MAG: hypothetical protein AAF404_06140, partial [Pseudomonadota bacterium]